MRLLIGSRALKYHGASFINNEANRTWDWDWIADYNGYNDFVNSIKNKRLNFIDSNKIAVFTKEDIHEFELAFKDSYLIELLNIAKNNSSVATLHESGEYYIANPNLVFALKKSHRFLKDSPHFLKTMLDYNHLKDIGCSVPDVLKNWYKVREKETYNYNHPKLKNVTKADFFKDDMVPYKYDHDSIHWAIKQLDQPAYNYFKENTSEVECAKELFDKCTDEIKLYSVLEEAYVLALERSQIPNNFTIEPCVSFNIALMKVCTSITSGWWREFAYNNYYKVKSIYSDNYVERFKAAINAGIVKDFVCSNENIAY